MKCNGPKICELRTRQAMTQEELAIAASVDRRTIQRAEDGKPLRLETMAAIASVLQVQVADITGENDSNYVDELESNAVVLKKTTSGKMVLDTIIACFSGLVECDIEPTVETANILIELVKEIEELMPDPWEAEQDGKRPMPLSDILRKSMSLSSRLVDLDRLGIGLFVGKYTSSAQIPYYLPEARGMVTSTRDPFQDVTICRLRISSNLGEKIVVLVDDFIKSSSGKLESLRNKPAVTTMMLTLRLHFERLQCRLVPAGTYGGDRA